MVKEKVMEYTHGLIKEFTKENEKKIKCMVKENAIGQVVVII